jgi:hypothetical protein
MIFITFAPNPLKGSIENQLIKVKFSIFPPSGDIGAVNIEIYQTLVKQIN